MATTIQRSTRTILGLRSDAIVTRSGAPELAPAELTSAYIVIATGACLISNILYSDIAMPRFLQQ